MRPKIQFKPNADLVEKLKRQRGILTADDALQNDQIIEEALSFSSPHDPYGEQLAKEHEFEKYIEEGRLAKREEIRRLELENQELINDPTSYLLVPGPGDQPIRSMDRSVQEQIRKNKKKIETLELELDENFNKEKKEQVEAFRKSVKNKEEFFLNPELQKQYRKQLIAGGLDERKADKIMESIYEEKKNVFLKAAENDYQGLDPNRKKEKINTQSRSYAEQAFFDENERSVSQLNKKERELIAEMEKAPVEEKQKYSDQLKKVREQIDSYNMNTSWLDYESKKKNKAPASEEEAAYNRDVNIAIEDLVKKTPNIVDQIDQIVQERYMIWKHLDTQVYEKVTKPSTEQQRLYGSSTTLPGIGGWGTTINLAQANQALIEEERQAHVLYEAAARLAYLNEDPSEREKSHFETFVKSAVNTIAGGLTMNLVTPQITRPSDVDINQSIVQLAVEDNIEMSPEELKNVELTLNDKIAAGSGASLGMLALFAATDKIGKSLGVDQVIRSTQLAKNMTVFGKNFGPTAAYLQRMAYEELKFMAVSGPQSIGTGSTFTLVGSGIGAIGRGTSKIARMATGGRSQVLQDQLHYWVGKSVVNQGLYGLVNKLPMSSLQLTATMRAHDMAMTTFKALAQQEDVKYELEKMFGPAEDLPKELYVEFISNLVFGIRAMNGPHEIKDFDRRMRSLYKELKTRGYDAKARQVMDMLEVAGLGTAKSRRQFIKQYKEFWDQNQEEIKQLRQELSPEIEMDKPVTNISDSRDAELKNRQERITELEGMLEAEKSFDEPNKTTIDKIESELETLKKGGPYAREVRKDQGQADQPGQERPEGQGDRGQDVQRPTETGRETSNTEESLRRQKVAYEEDVVDRRKVLNTILRYAPGSKFTDIKGTYDKLQNDRKKALEEATANLRKFAENKKIPVDQVSEKDRNEIFKRFDRLDAAEQALRQMWWDIRMGRKSEIDLATELKDLEVKTFEIWQQEREKNIERLKRTRDFLASVKDLTGQDDVTPDNIESVAGEVINRRELLLNEAMEKHLQMIIKTGTVVPEKINEIYSGVERATKTVKTITDLHRVVKMPEYADQTRRKTPTTPQELVNETKIMGYDHVLTNEQQPFAQKKSVGGGTDNPNPETHQNLSKVKVGDIVDLQYVSKEKADQEGLDLGIKRSTGEPYKYWLTFLRGGLQVGSIAYESPEAKKAIELMEQNQTVKAVVTSIVNYAGKPVSFTYELISRPFPSSKGNPFRQLRHEQVNRWINRMEKMFGTKAQVIDDPREDKRGWVSETGQPVINLARASATDPAHEYLHPFLANMRLTNPDAYQALLRSIWRTPDLFTKVNEMMTKYPELEETPEYFDEYIIQAVSIASDPIMSRPGWRITIDDFYKHIRAILRGEVNRFIGPEDFNSHTTIEDLIDMLTDPTIQVKAYTDVKYDKEGISPNVIEATTNEMMIPAGNGQMIMDAREDNRTTAELMIENVINNNPSEKDYYDIITLYDSEQEAPKKRKEFLHTYSGTIKTFRQKTKQKISDSVRGIADFRTHQIQEYIDQLKAIQREIESITPDKGQTIDGKRLGSALDKYLQLPTQFEDLAKAEVKDDMPRYGDETPFDDMYYPEVNQPTPRKSEVYRLINTITAAEKIFDKMPDNASINLEQLPNMGSIPAVEKTMMRQFLERLNVLYSGATKIKAGQFKSELKEFIREKYPLYEAVSRNDSYQGYGLGWYASGGYSEWRRYVIFDNKRFTGSYGDFHHFPGVGQGLFFYSYAKMRDGSTTSHSAQTDILDNLKTIKLDINPYSRKADRQNALQKRAATRAEIDKLFMDIENGDTSPAALSMLESLVKTGSSDVLRRYQRLLDRKQDIVNIGHEELQDVNIEHTMYSMTTLRIEKEADRREDVQAKLFIQSLPISIISGLQKWSYKERIETLEHWWDINKESIRGKVQQKYESGVDWYRKSIDDYIKNKKKHSDSADLIANVRKGNISRSEFIKNFLDDIVSSGRNTPEKDVAVQILLNARTHYLKAGGKKYIPVTSPEIYKDYRREARRLQRMGMYDHANIDLFYERMRKEAIETFGPYLDKYIIPRYYEGIKEAETRERNLVKKQSKSIAGLISKLRTLHRKNELWKNPEAETKMMDYYFRKMAMLFELTNNEVDKTYDLVRNERFEKLLELGEVMEKPLPQLPEENPEAQKIIIDENSKEAARLKKEELAYYEQMYKIQFRMFIEHSIIKALQDGSKVHYFPTATASSKLEGNDIASTLYVAPFEVNKEMSREDRIRYYMVNNPHEANRIIRDNNIPLPADPNTPEAIFELTRNVMERMPERILIQWENQGNFTYESVGPFYLALKEIKGITFKPAIPSWGRDYFIEVDISNYEKANPGLNVRRFSKMSDGLQNRLDREEEYDRNKKEQKKGSFYKRFTTRALKELEGYDAASIAENADNLKKAILVVGKNMYDAGITRIEDLELQIKEVMAEYNPDMKELYDIAIEEMIPDLQKQMRGEWRKIREEISRDEVDDLGDLEDETPETDVTGGTVMSKEKKISSLREPFKRLFIDLKREGIEQPEQRIHRIVSTPEYQQAMKNPVTYKEFLENLAKQDPIMGNYMTRHLNYSKAVSLSFYKDMHLLPVVTYSKQAGGKLVRLNTNRPDRVALWKRTMQDHIRKFTYKDIKDPNKALAAFYRDYLAAEESEYKKIAYRATKGPEENEQRRQDLFNFYTEFLSKLTGLSRESWAGYFHPNWEADYYSGNLNSPMPKIISSLKKSNSPFKQSNIAESVYKYFADKPAGVKYSNIEKMSLVSGDQFEFDVFYTTVEGNQKYSYEQSNDMLLSASDVSKRGQDPHYANNDYVQMHRQAGKAPIALIDGIFNNKTGNASEATRMADTEFLSVLMHEFNAPGDTYLHWLGQFGDKDQAYMTQVRKYAEPKKRYQQLMEQIHDKDLLKAVDKDIKKMKKVIINTMNASSAYENVRGEKAVKFVEDFLYNEIINRYFTTEYYYGDPRKYESTVMLIARKGSSNSPGYSPNIHVANGVGPTRNVIFLNDPNGVVFGKKTKELDGQILMHGDWGERFRRSIGSVLSREDIFPEVTTIKSIDSDIIDGERYLVKSNMFLLDKLGEQHPESLYGKILEWVRNVEAQSGKKIDHIVFTSSYKLGPYKSMTVFDGMNFLSPKELPEIIERPNERFLVQQDLRHEAKARKAKQPVQLNPNMMYLESGKGKTDLTTEMAKIWNEKALRLADQYIQSRTTATEADLRRSILSDMSRESNPDLYDYILNGGNLSNPYYENYIRKSISSGITRKVLERRSNRVQLLDLAPLDLPVKFMREITFKGKRYVLPSEAIGNIEGARYPRVFKTLNEALLYSTQYEDMKDADGKVREWEIEKVKDGYRVPGEPVLVSRIPASAPHSHALVRLGDKLEGMGNVLILPKELREIAGFDYDGDDHKVDVIVKKRLRPNSGGTDFDPLSYDMKDPVNKTIIMLQQAWENPENYRMLTDAIDINRYDRTVNNIRANDDPMDFLSLFDNINMRKNVKSGERSIGIVANMMTTYDYIRKMNITRKGREIPLPEVYSEDNKPTGNKTKLRSFARDRYGVLKNAGATMLNITVDNVKKPKAAELAITEQTSAMVIAALASHGELDNSKSVKEYEDNITRYIDNIAAFFNLPVAKEFIRRVRETKNTDSENTVRSIITRLQQRYPSEATTIHALQGLYYLSADLNRFFSIIKATREAPKDIGEYYELVSSLDDITRNKLRNIDMTNIFSGDRSDYHPLIKMAAESVRLAEEVTFRGSIDIDKNTNKIVDHFDSEAKSNRGFGLDKDEMNRTISNIKRYILIRSFDDGRSFREIQEDLIKKVEENPNHPFYSHLDINYADVSSPDKKSVAIESAWSKVNPPESELRQIRDAMDALPKEEQDALLLYSLIRYGLKQSSWDGNFAKFFGLGFMDRIGKIMERNAEEWNQMEFDPILTDKIISDIKELEQADIKKGNKEGGVFEMRKEREFASELLDMVDRSNFQAQTAQKVMNLLVEAKTKGVRPSEYINEKLKDNKAEHDLYMSWYQTYNHPQESRYENFQSLLMEKYNEGLNAYRYIERQLQGREGDLKRFNTWREQVRTNPAYRRFSEFLNDVKKEQGTFYDKLRRLKIGDNMAFGGFGGVPVAVWNGAIETIIAAHKAGVSIGKAIKDGIDYMKTHPSGYWNTLADPADMERQLRERFHKEYYWQDELEYIKHGKNPYAFREGREATEKIKKAFNGRIIDIPFENFVNTIDHDRGYIDKYLLTSGFTQDQIDNMTFDVKAHYYATEESAKVELERVYYNDITGTVPILKEPKEYYEFYPVLGEKEYHNKMQIKELSGGTMERRKIQGTVIDEVFMPSLKIAFEYAESESYRQYLRDVDAARRISMRLDEFDIKDLQSRDIDRLYEIKQRLSGLDIQAGGHMLETVNRMLFMHDLKQGIQQEVQDPIPFIPNMHAVVARRIMENKNPKDMRFSIPYFGEYFILDQEINANQPFIQLYLRKFLEADRNINTIHQSSVHSLNEFQKKLSPADIRKFIETDPVSGYQRFRSPLQIDLVETYPELKNQNVFDMNSDFNAMTHIISEFVAINGKPEKFLVRMKDKKMGQELINYLEFERWYREMLQEYHPTYRTNKKLTTTFVPDGMISFRKFIFGKSKLDKEIGVSARKKLYSLFSPSQYDNVIINNTGTTLFDMKMSYRNITKDNYRLAIQAISKAKQDAKDLLSTGPYRDLTEARSKRRRVPLGIYTGRRYPDVLVDDNVYVGVGNAIHSIVEKHFLDRVAPYADFVVQKQGSGKSYRNAAKFINKHVGYNIYKDPLEDPNSFKSKFWNYATMVTATAAIPFNLTAAFGNIAAGYSHNIIQAPEELLKGMKDATIRPDLMWRAGNVMQKNQIANVIHELNYDGFEKVWRNLVSASFFTMHYSEKMIQNPVFVGLVGRERLEKAYNPDGTPVMVTKQNPITGKKEQVPHDLVLKPHEIQQIKYFLANIHGSYGAARALYGKVSVGRAFGQFWWPWFYAMSKNFWQNSKSDMYGNYRVGIVNSIAKDAYFLMYNNNLDMRMRRVENIQEKINHGTDFYDLSFMDQLLLDAAGDPVEWKRLPKAQKNGILKAAVYGGLLALGVFLRQQAEEDVLELEYKHKNPMTGEWEEKRDLDEYPAEFRQKLWRRKMLMRMSEMFVADLLIPIDPAGIIYKWTGEKDRPADEMFYAQKLAKPIPSVYYVQRIGNMVYNGLAGERYEKSTEGYKQGQLKILHDLVKLIPFFGHPINDAIVMTRRAKDAPYYERLERERKKKVWEDVIALAGLESDEEFIKALNGGEYERLPEEYLQTLKATLEIYYDVYKQSFALEEEARLQKIEIFNELRQALMNMSLDPNDIRYYDPLVTEFEQYQKNMESYLKMNEHVLPDDIRELMNKTVETDNEE